VEFFGEVDGAVTAEEGEDSCEEAYEGAGTVGRECG